MPRLSLVLAALLVGCGAPATPTPNKPAVVTPPAKPPGPPPVAEPVAPPVTPPGSVATPTSPKPLPPPIAGVRDKQPLPGMPECLEMYSACSPDGKGGQQCTSARFTLACGETGKVPGGGDTLRCVCP